MPTEIEARFRATTEPVLDELAAWTRLGAAELGDPVASDEVDRYLDSADGRLAEARWACRLRSRGDGWRVSLKGPMSLAEPGHGPAWFHARPELEGPASDSVDPADWPPSPARDRLVELSGGAPLAEQVRLLQRRRERSVTADGRRVATLSLDVARIVAHGVAYGTLLVAELELAPDAPTELLAPMAATLAAVPGLEADPCSKLERALERIRHAAERIGHEAS